MVWPLGSNLNWQECICFIGSLIWFGLSMNPLRLASAFVGCCLWKFDSIIFRAAEAIAWSFFSHINRLNPEGPHFTLPAIRVRLLFRIAVLPQKHFIKNHHHSRNTSPQLNFFLLAMHTLTSSNLFQPFVDFGNSAAGYYRGSQTDSFSSTSSLFSPSSSSSPPFSPSSLLFPSSSTFPAYLSSSYPRANQVTGFRGSAIGSGPGKYAAYRKSDVASKLKNKKFDSGKEKIVSKLSKPDLRILGSKSASKKPSLYEALRNRASMGQKSLPQTAALLKSTTEEVISNNSLDEFPVSFHPEEELARKGWKWTLLTHCFHVSDFVSKCLVNLSVNSEALENVFQSKKLRQGDVFRHGVMVDCANCPAAAARRVQSVSIKGSHQRDTPHLFLNGQILFRGFVYFFHRTSFSDKLGSSQVASVAFLDFALFIISELLGLQSVGHGFRRPRLWASKQVRIPWDMWCW